MEQVHKGTHILLTQTLRFCTLHRPWYLFTVDTYLHIYILRDWTTGLRFPAGAPRPNRLWGPTSLISNGYEGVFPQE